MSTGSSVTIGLLLPDVLGTYSDSGNATILAQRLRWRGVSADILRCPADRPPPSSCEIYVLGGGEDTAQLFAAGWLRRHDELCAAMAGEAVTLAVCAGMQILGEWMEGPDGERHAGAGLLDLTTRPRRHRATGEVVADCALPGVGVLSGFENHAGATSLGVDVGPLGRVLAGVGNGDPNGSDAEGAVSGRIVATYLHGPVLARNPALADFLLTEVIGPGLAEIEVPDQADLRRTYVPAVRAGRRSAGQMMRRSR
ncbi:MAG TPA: glutamine amidotransferase [Pseudonocardia sp.]|nr:glutamine amidotransferase [Pseudonocardia sp.]